MSNPNIRCPLPPVGADPDSLRQFEGNESPKFRVLPLIPPTGGTTTVTTSGGSSSSGGSGGSGGTTPTAINAKTVTLTIGAVGPNAAVRTQLSLSQSYQLVSLTANNPCCIRLYGTAAAQSGDSVRPPDNPVPAEITMNLIIDVVLDTVPYVWQTQNIVGANQDSPQSATTYITVINPSVTGLSNVVVTITYAPLET